jgi:hypothetical protein
MGKVSLYILLVLIVLLAVAALFKIPLTRRQRILSYAFPEGWQHHLRAHFPLYNELGEQTITQLHRQLQLLIAECEIMSLGSIEIKIQERLLSLAPWLCLNLALEKHHPLKRIMLMTLEESRTMTPQEDSQELLLIWLADLRKLKIPSHLRTDQGFGKLLTDESLSAEQWLEICYKEKPLENSLPERLKKNLMK